MRIRRPGWRDRLEADGLRRNVSALAKRNNRLAGHIVQLRGCIKRLRAQIRYDQRYTDLLEEFVTHEDIASCREQMRQERQAARG